MTTRMTPREGTTQPPVVRENRKAEICRSVASRLTEGTVRIQYGKFLTEEDLNNRRAKILAYDRDED